VLPFFCLTNFISILDKVLRGEYEIILSGYFSNLNIDRAFSIIDNYLSVARPKWRNWQTRGIQNPVRFTPGEGSSPSFGSVLFITNSNESNFTMKDRLLFAVAGSRLIVSRVFGLAIILLLVFTTHSFSRESFADIFSEMSGLFLLSICSFGRLWALMYISGNKRRELVTEGPYSVVRHPLYFFSFIGAIGIGLASENLLVLALIIVFYVFYYPFTILMEERNLTVKFGEAYIEYMKRTPRFFPRLSLYKEPSVYQVKARSFVKSFVNGMWFIWIYMLLHIIEMLHESGILPVFMRIP
jgi:protein-S-isoprenylcysteine O-methyltransferase Ste14